MQKHNLRNSNQKTPPPSWSTRLLSWFMKEEYYEDIQGDLEEEYKLLLNHKGLGKAKRWYSWQIIKLFRPSMAKKVKAQDSIKKETTMFRNYLKIGLRNLWKYKSGTVINMIGLSTGIAAFTLIALFVRDELSYDKHFEEAEKIYRVTVKNYNRSGNLNRQWAFASSGHAERLKADYPEVEYATRFYAWAFPDLTYLDKKFPSEQVVFADTDVFNVFSFQFILGDPSNAFKDVFSIVLTEQTAIKFFGSDWKDEDILGKTITLSRDENKAPFKVTGVIEDMPEQQHFHFDYLAPLRFLSNFFGEETLNNNGGNYNWLTYIKISPNTDIEGLTEKANDEFWDKYLGTFSSGAEARDLYDFEFQPLLDIHLTSNLEGEYETNGSIQLVYIFSAIAILILLVACVNYMNISTSHYSRRMREVGVRKIIGAFRSSLIKQFLTESILVNFISLPLSILLIIWGLPHLNEFIEKEMTFNLFTDLDLLISLIVLLFTVAIVAGVYPAIFLSKINLVQALKGEQAINSNRWNFRFWLVAFQYIVTIGLIFSIAVIERQMSFIRNSDPGYDREHIVVLDLTRNIDNLETFKTEMSRHPNILNSSYSSRIPTGRLMDSWRSRFYKGDSLIATNFRLPVISVDSGFLTTYGIELVAGENFREGMKTELARDTIMPGYYILNEAAVEAYGFEDANEIIGRKMRYGPTEGQIVGVMKDFHFESLHSEIVPMILLYRENYRVMSLKIKHQDIAATLEHIEETYSRFESEINIDYLFLDELFEMQYTQEQRTGEAIKVFAAIAILIGCLGLIGMVGFIIETKMKEIGVRKVLGASTRSIWTMISNRFLILIGIAYLIGLPLSYWLMNDWLQQFVYRTDISILTILTPVAVAIILTLIAISYQTIKATRINPVECLKDE